LFVGILEIRGASVDAEVRPMMIVIVEERQQAARSDEWLEGLA
jgi:hypothetical protein